MEPDQIDMMNESELREELRSVVSQNIELRAILLGVQESVNNADARVAIEIAAVQTRQANPALLDALKRAGKHIESMTPEEMQAFIDACDDSEK